MNVLDIEQLNSIKDAVENNKDFDIKQISKTKVNKYIQHKGQLLVKLDPSYFTASDLEVLIEEFKMMKQIVSNK